MRAMDRLGTSRIGSAALVAALHALILAALLQGLGVSLPRDEPDRLVTFDVRELPEPPPPRSVAAKRRTPQREGAASPANLRSRAAPVVAPLPEVRLDLPPPVTAAPIPAAGLDRSSGASDRPGPGTGSGGVGEGTGSGRSGDGTGGGGGRETPLRWLSGRITNEDYPLAALDAGQSGTVHLRFVVGVKGRVTDCTVTRSSGSRALDETTCRLIKRRFRYRPTLDARGRPVPDVVTGTHEWWLTDQPPD